MNTGKTGSVTKCETGFVGVVPRQLSGNFKMIAELKAGIEVREIIKRTLAVGSNCGGLSRGVFTKEWQLGLTIRWIPTIY